jgi:hypothetical protein
MTVGFLIDPVPLHQQNTDSAGVRQVNVQLASFNIDMISMLKQGMPACAESLGNHQPQTRCCFLFLACCLVKTIGKFGAAVGDAIRGWLKLIYLQTLRSQVMILIIPYSSFIPPMLPVIVFFPVLFLRKPFPSLFFQIVRFFSHVTSSGQHFSHGHFFKVKDVLNFLFMKY